MGSDKVPCGMVSDLRTSQHRPRELNTSHRLLPFGSSFHEVVLYRRGC